MKMKFRHTFPASVVSTLVLHLNASPALADAPKAVKVAEGSLIDAVDSLGKQYSVDVIYPSSQLKGLTTVGLNGVMDRREAFERLIAGTELIIKEDGRSLMITLPPKSSAFKKISNTAPLTGPLRVAQVTTGGSAVGSSSPAKIRLAASSARTSNTSTPSGASDQLEEVVITGSRLQRKDIESVSPISMVSDEDIANRGFIRLEEILGHMPQLQTTQDTSGRTFVNLRGLGAVRTLVLVNGRRLQPGGYGSTASASAADPSIVPPGLIKRVEILTGGASSVYGADAVAGVVNFVMDKEFEGFEISGGVSGFQHDNDNDLVPGLMDARGEDFYAKGNSLDGGQYRFDVMAGGKFDDGNGHISAYLGWDKSSLLTMNARDYSSCALDSTSHCSGSFEAGKPNFNLPGLRRDVTLQDDGSLTPYTDNLANWGNNLSMRHPATRIRGGAFVNYEVNEHFKPYFELNFMRAESRNYYDETATFGLPATLSCSSPLLSASQQATICGPTGLNISPTSMFNVNLYKRNVEGPARYWDKTYDSMRTVAGIEGEIAGSWRYDASFLYGKTVSAERGANVFSRQRVLNALNVTRDAQGNLVCVSGGNCVPYQVFTPGAITQAQLNYLTTDHYIDGDASATVVNAYVAGDLPLTVPFAVNPLALVFGTEYRKETFNTFFDDPQIQGDILGRSRQSNTTGDYDVKEAFVEAAVPLVEDKPFVKSLSAELGYRYSDYSLAGTQDTWKIGLNYRPIDQLKLRGGFNRAVRAPNVIELFRPQSNGLWNGTDPCSGATPIYTAEQCARTGVTAARYGQVSANPVGQFNQIAGGNPDLDPEQADTVTIGFVASPLDRLNISVDYWDIKIDDVIGTVGAQTAINQCATTAEPALCGLIHRAADGNLWRDLLSGAGGYISATNANLGQWHFRGVDLAVDYQLPVFTGDVKFGLTGSRFLKKFFENVKGVPSSQYDCEGQYSSTCNFPTPKWRHTFGATYLSNSFWTATANWRYYGAVDNPRVSTGIDSGISAQSFFDLSGTFKVTDKISVVTGVNNILDKEPPLVSLNLSTNYFNTVDGYYDMLGRFLHLSATMKF